MYILFCVNFVSSIILFFIILELCNFLLSYHRPQHQSHLLVITVLAGGNKYWTSSDLMLHKRITVVS